MPKSKRKIYVHPYLRTNGKIVFLKKDEVIKTTGLLNCVRASRHHLYPKDRGDIVGVDREKFLLRMWDYKHFRGWNHLFQFCFIENGVTKCSELTIDEIITLMAISHPFITDKIGTKPWKILFKEKNLDEACDLLCRMLAIKFNYQWQKTFPQKITLVVTQAA